MSKNYAPLTIESAREKLLANRNRRLEIDIPEWECSVIIKPITLIEQIELQRMNKSEDPNINLKIGCKILQLSLIDEQGNQLYTEDELIDLLNNNNAVMLPIVNKVYDFNGMSQKSQKEEKDSFLSPNIDLPIS